MKILRNLAIGAGAAWAVTMTVLLATVPSHAGSAPLVYVCPSVQGTAPQCQNGQEFEVFDHNGAPVFSVGEYGGAAVFGDNLGVVPPGSLRPDGTLSYTDPVTYDHTFGLSTSCTVPQLWIDAQHYRIYKCVSGTWKYSQL